MALRRLDQFLDAIKPDKKDKGQANSGGKGGGGQSGGGGRGPAGDDIPPLAQLKALRALQAEINQQTEKFAAAHPEAAKLSDADQAELKLLSKMERDIAELVQEFSPADEPKEDKP